MPRLSSLPLAAGLLLALSGLATAATGSLSISVTVKSACKVRDATLTFPTYVSGQSKDLRAEGKLIVENCLPGTLTIALDGGGSGDVNNRRLRNGAGNTLSYQLYRDPALSSIAGLGRDAVTGELNSGTSRSFTIYGVIPARQSVPPGVYSDTVMLTLEF